MRTAVDIDEAIAARTARARRLIDLVGNTPMVDLSELTGREQVKLYAKAEYLNPGGSVKDRPARAMVLDAIARGVLTRDKRILDSTSGNTGIAEAMVGAALGYGVTLCLPENASPERKRILRAYGAELVITDPLQGSDGAILEARRLAADQPARYVYLDQYSNPENWRAHYRTTGPEIWAQTDGQITHFVTGLGTSGTFVGTGRFLREQSPAVRLVSVEPDSPMHGLEGMKHMATAIVPAIYDPSIAHEKREASTETAYEMVKRLARQQGLLVGISAGANVAVALQIASAIEEGVVVTILCDNADKYLSDRFWDEP
jgi:S-sulfo-L-cysteine synthase (O-acetyl-L-serine-dependent)